MALSVSGATLDGRRVGLRAEDGRITELGPDVAAREGDEVLDGAGTALAPGLLNGHTHAAMSLFRGSGDDLPLMEWLQNHVWPIEAKLDDDDVYWGTRLACVEMIRTGTVLFWDMYWRPGAIARAVEDAGIRAVVGSVLVDGNDAARSAELRRVAEHGLEEIASAGPRVRPALAPHAIYTVSESSLRWVAETAAERDLPIHIHVSETEGEVEDCVRDHGARPLRYMDDLGILGPRTLGAHAVWLDDSEFDLVAERGSTLVTNPVSQMKLAVGRVFDYRSARGRSIPVGLGTDGAGTNDSLDLLQDVKHFALIQKHAAGDPRVISAEEALEIATGARAPLLGASGRVAVGEPADFLLVRVDSPELGIGPLSTGLVYAATGAVVDATVVDGRVLMRGGEVPGAEEVLARARERATRLGLRPDPGG
jgi:5-methylthioadenosine/S-adenosylhomocysteine deaminase